MSRRTYKKKSKSKSKSKSYYKKIIKRHESRILWLQPHKVGFNGGDADMEIDEINKKINKLKKKLKVKN
jgi:hypothetical protein